MDKYLIDLIETVEGVERQILPTTIAEGVTLGTLPAGALNLPGAEANETLETTFANIKAILTNMVDIFNQKRAVTADYDTESEYDIPTMKALATVKKAVDEFIAAVGETEDGAIDLATFSHAAEDTRHGGGDADSFGHVKLVDTYDQDVATTGAAANSVAASAAALYNAYTALNSAIEEHAEVKATGDAAGHVILSDATNDTESDAESGVAATPKAIATLKAEISEIVEELEDHVTKAEQNFSKMSLMYAREVKKIETAEAGA